MITSSGLLEVMIQSLSFEKIKVDTVNIKLLSNLYFMYVAQIAILLAWIPRFASDNAPSTS